MKSTMLTLTGYYLIFIGLSIVVQLIFDNNYKRNNLEQLMITHWNSKQRILTIHPTDENMIICIDTNCKSVKEWIQK